MSRLQDIDDELSIVINQIKELHSRNNELNKERTEIIQNNCDHNFEWTGYCEDDFERDIIMYENICSKCGLRMWEEI